MYKITELSDDKLEAFSKIYYRHLKELGLYTPVKKYFSEHMHMSVKTYMKTDKHRSYIISDLVNIVWHPIFNATNLAVKSSILVINILLDRNFFDFVYDINKKRFSLVTFYAKVQQSIYREFSYLLELDDLNYQMLSENDVDMLNEAYDTYISRFGEEPFRYESDKEKFFIKLHKS